MPLPPPHSSTYMPPPSANGNHTPANTNHMLDYLESQVRGMDMNSPLLQVCNCLCSQGTFSKVQLSCVVLGITMKGTSSGRHLYLHLYVFFPSVPATSTPPHAAYPTSSPAHGRQHSIFPRPSQHDLCP